MEAPQKKGAGKRFGVGSKAPPEFAEKPAVSADMKPLVAPQAYVARPMFAAAGKKKNNRPKPAEKPPAAEKPAEKPPAEKPAEQLAEVLEKHEEGIPAEDIFGGLEGELKEMSELIVKGMSDNLYNTEVPVAYVPQTRRGFAEFIKTSYAPFELPDGPITIPEGEKYYPYQKFVREESRKDKYKGLKPDERLAKIAKAWKKHNLKTAKQTRNGNTNPRRGIGQNSEQSIR